MIKPPYLMPGDKIGIVSTASKIDKLVVEPAVEWLKIQGYRVELGEHTFAQSNQFAGTHEQRSLDLQAMLNDSSIKAIICSRGGYGTLHTIEKISWHKFMQSPKWLVGFSDITVLHAQLNQLGICAIHGVMPRYFLEEKQATKSLSTLMDALTGKPINYEVAPSKNNRLGSAVGELVGGNLSILYSLRGTPYDIDTDGKILFIEDVSEYLYHLDRMMMNLKTGAKLSNLAGLIVGGLTNMKDNETPFGSSAEEIIASAINEYNFPVIFNFPAGHQPNNYAIKIGAMAQININSTIVSFNQ